MTLYYANNSETNTEAREKWLTVKIFVIIEIHTYPSFFAF